MNANITTTTETTGALNAEFIREYLKLSPPAQACIFASLRAIAALHEGNTTDAGAWLQVAKTIMPHHAERLENLVNN